MHTRSQPRNGFTLTELLVVIGIIAVLMAVLLPALAGVWKTGHMTSSANNLKQIAAYMQLYSDDNRQFIVPSQFDYSQAAAGGYPIKVRSNVSPQQGEQYKGTWTDILWSMFSETSYPTAGLAAGSGGLGNDYRHDSPDKALYDLFGDDSVKSPFRSVAFNTKEVSGGDVAKPFGTGAQEMGYAGFFAANNFFDARPCDNCPSVWFTQNQIRFPDRSLYLVDSFAGETITAPEEGSNDPDPFNTDPAVGTLEVDFRYDDACLMLMLDGSINTEGPWSDINTLEGTRKIRVRDLDER